MSITREEEIRRFRQLHRLNYFYAITVVVMALITLILLFNLSLEQRQIINDVGTLVEERTQEAEVLDMKSQERLSQALSRVDELEALIEERLEPDRLLILEENLINKIERLIEESCPDC